MAALVDIALANTVGVFVDRFNDLNQRMTSLTVDDGSLSVANTNILGGTLLVTSNTNINGTLKVNGANLDDNALAFSIALG
jgi:hypothetical protein